MGAMMFRSRGVNHQVNWGNCYAEIVRTVRRTG
jgi:phage portal protein BeeE